MKMELHQYKVSRVVDIHDGDTITVDLDLGFYVTFTAVLRFYGINAPEIFGTEKPKGEASRDFVVKRIGEAKEIIVKTFRIHEDETKTGKYGRYLAEIYLDGVMLNQEMLDKGYAVPYMGTLTPNPSTGGGTNGS